MKPRPQPEQPSWDWREEVWRSRSKVRANGVAGGKGCSGESFQVSTPSALPLADQSALDSELALERLLSRLPTPHVSNNLAARVLAKVTQESIPNKSAHGLRLWGSIASLWSRFGLRSLAWGSGLAVLLVAIVLQEKLHERRAMAREVAEMGAVTAIPGVEVLQNFDAISALGAGVRVHPTDIDLMAAMVAMGN